MSHQLINKNNLEKLIELFRSGKYAETLKICNSLINKFDSEPFLFNLKGMAEIKLNEFQNSVLSFKSAIRINPNYVEAYNNLATNYINLGQFEDAINYLKKAIKIRPDYANAYNNLASAQADLGKYKDAINSFNKLLMIEPNFPGVKENIIKTLTFYTPLENNLNIYVELNNSIKKINLNGEINEKNIINFYKKCQNIVGDKLNDLNFNFSQIWRRNNIDLNCSRHFDVFRNFNVIPEFCFKCFKVQIELKSLVDLFKLYFIFDKLNLKNNKSRKCLIELRKIAKTNYKGLIYCSSLEEASEIQSIISEEIKKNLKENININLKRGCTEFGIAYPDYKKIDIPENNFMKYNNEWKDKEKIIDSKFPKKNRINQRVLNSTITGFTLNDFLIMKNWVMYAKRINDNDFCKFDKNITVSKFMEYELSTQLDFRKMN